MKILFVCTGNTCRSPMAEAIFNHLAKKEGISAIADSAGISALTGFPAAENAVLALKETGIDLSGHLSKPVTKELLSERDRIYCMSKSHINAITDCCPEFTDKVFLLGGGIDDPYSLPLVVYNKARDEIMKAVAEIIKELGNDNNKA